MRTTIDIDDRLMRDAMRSSGARTKRAAVEQALRLLIQTRAARSSSVDSATKSKKNSERYHRM